MGFQNLFGSTSSSSGLVDLTNYYTKSEADALLTAKANLTGGKHVAGEVTDLAITTVHTVTNNTQRDALVTGGNIQAGDVVIVTDTQITWIYNGSGYQQIDATEVSWDNVKSSANKSATTKFGELDTAIAAKVTATGTSGNWMFLNQGSNNTTQYVSIDIKTAGGTGTSLIALDGYANDGSKLNSSRSAVMGGSSNVGHYVLKNFLATSPLSHQLSGNDQTLQIGFAQTSSSDNNKFLKYVHGGTPIWDTPASSGGSSTFTGLSDSPGSITANEAVRGNSVGNGLEFFNPQLIDAASVGSQVSLKGTSHSATSNTIKTLKAGTGVTLTTPEDSNCIQINSTATGGASINDGSISSSTVYSSSKIDSTYLQQSKVKNSTSTTAGDVYDVRHVDSQLAGKANTSHTHVISDVTNLQTSLDAKLSTTVNTLGTGGTSLHIVSGTQLGLKRLNAGSNVTIGESNGDITIAATAEVNDAVTGASTTYSSNKIVNDYVPYTNVHGSTRSGSNEVYNAPYVNTQLGNKLATSVSNLGSSGIQLHSVTGQALSLKTLAGAGLASVTESAGIITVTGNADTNKADVTYVNTQVANLIDDTQHTTTKVWSSSNTRNEIIGRVGSLVSKTLTSSQNVASVLTTSQTTFTANNELVSKQYVDTQVANLVDSAPATLNTLNELAAALGDDANFSTTVTNSIAAKLPLAGGALTGNVTTNLANSAFTATSLVSKNYVDNAVGGAGGATTFTALTDTPSTFTNDRFLKTTGSAVVDFELNSKTLKWDFYSAIGDLPAASSNHGMLAHVHAEGAVYFAHNGNWVKLANSSELTPAVSSGVNQYVLSNDGTNPVWMSSLQASANTVNIGTSTLKKFATWVSGTFLEYFMKGSPSNGDTLGTIVFSDTTLNQYTTIGGRVGDTASGAQYGYNLLQAARGGSMVDIMRVGKTGASDPHDVYVNGSMGAHELKFVNPATGAVKGTSQAYPVEAPTTAGHVLTAGAGGTWSWAAASGGGGSSIPTSRQLNVSTATSGNSYQITAADGSTTYTGAFHLFGERFFHWILEETLYSPTYITGRIATGNASSGGRNISPRLWMNGYLGASTNNSSDRNAYGYTSGQTSEENCHLGGHIYMYRPSYAYNFTKLYWIDWGGQGGSYNMSDTNWTSSSESRWAIMASEDGKVWVTLACFGSSGSTGWSYNGVSSISKTVSTSFPYGLSAGGYSTSAKNNTITFSNSNYYQYWMIKNIDATGTARKSGAPWSGASPHDMLRIGGIHEIMWG